MSTLAFQTSGESITLKVPVDNYSETGNTKKIAKTIYEEASKEHEAHLREIKDISADMLNDYDLVFLGSACHSSDLAAPVKEILKALPKSPKFKLAGFFTHSTWTPEQNEHGQALFDEWASKCIDSFESVSEEKRIDFRGYYHCQGAPSLPIQAFIRSAIIKPDDEWETYIWEARKHPNQEDLEKASDFARKIMSMPN
jgi:flavodoxin